MNITYLGKLFPVFVVVVLGFGDLHITLAKGDETIGAGIRTGLGSRQSPPVYQIADSSSDVSKAQSTITDYISPCLVGALSKMATAHASIRTGKRYGYDFYCGGDSGSTAFSPTGGKVYLVHTNEDWLDSYLMIDDTARNACLIVLHVQPGTVKVKANDKVSIGTYLAKSHTKSRAGHIHVEVFDADCRTANRQGWANSQDVPVAWKDVVGVSYVASIGKDKRPVVKAWEVSQTDVGWHGGKDYRVAFSPKNPGHVATPVPRTPRVGGLLNDSTPSFAWDRAANATSYEFQLSESPAFKSLLGTYRGQKTTFIYSTPLKEGVYFWRVRSHNSELGFSSWWSPVWGFGLDLTPPAAPRPIAPLNGLTVSAAPRFAWTQPASSFAYQLQIDRSVVFRSPVFDRSGITMATYNSAALPAAYKNFWRVRARDVAGNWGAWSTVSHYYYLSLVVPPVIVPPGSTLTITPVTTTSTAIGYPAEPGATPTPPNTAAVPSAAAPTATVEVAITQIPTDSPTPTATLTVMISPTATLSPVPTSTLLPPIICDDGEPCFSRGPNAAWNVPTNPAQYCKWNGDALYGYACFTSSTCQANTDLHSVFWNPGLLSGGRFAVYAYIPRIDSATPHTTGARYYLRCPGSDAASASLLATINQAAYQTNNSCDDSVRWAYLGIHNFEPGCYVELRAFTSESETQWGYKHHVVLADALKWIQVP